MAEPPEEDGLRSSPHNLSSSSSSSSSFSLSPGTDPLTIPAPERGSVMDVDGDLEARWALDQISFVSSPMSMSPLLHSSSYELPPSPLWGFSDDWSPGDAFSCSPFITYNPDTVTESPTGNEDKSMALPPLLLSPLSELISPENPERSYLMKERMTQALRYLNDSTEQHILAQVWVPIKNGGRCMLTTSGQPFVLDPHTHGLHQYRMVSLKYKFIVEGGCDGDLGLPGRVFQLKLPEWTPNVQYYSWKEYPRLTHALHYNVRGSLALPVFESSGESCVGVLELIMTLQKINYASDFDKICKALEAVNLRSSEVLDHQNTTICDEGCQNALAEILEILSVVCETHKLPLAQTWVPCRHRSVLSDYGSQKKSCIEQVCMSTSDKAFYLIDAHIWGFREACAEHHLQKGQGVAGRAFASHNSCFCNNITQFNKNEYPLVHYARMFRLNSCFAICLRSTHTGNDDYVLEFFLPPSITGGIHQQALLYSLLDTMKQHFRTLEVAMGDEISVEILNSSIGDGHCSASDSIRISQTSESLPLLEAFPGRRETRETQPLEDKLLEVADVVEVGGHKAVSASENLDLKTPSLTRKRGKKEKAISLEVLQQYFAGSLKDAAKSLGVCSTTMKRICRQHGISRWPSRKIKKVNHSLSKLKRVIESVQGVEGAVSLTGFTGLNGSNQQNSPSPKPSESEDDTNEFHTCESPRSDELVEGDQILRSVALKHEKSAHERSGFLPELGDDGSNSSKTKSTFKEEGMGTGTLVSHNPCHNRLQGETATDANAANDLSKPSEAIDSLKFTFQHPEVNLSTAFTFPDVNPTQEVLIENAGSTKDLKNWCPSEDDLPDSSWAHSPSTEPQIRNQDVNTVVIKASYRGNIVRFKFTTTCGIAEMKEEIATRLKLEIGIFELKYLDDDQDWVLMACDADLQECVDVLRSSGSKKIRLLVSDILPNLGSCCVNTYCESPG